MSSFGILLHVLTALNSLITNDFMRRRIQNGAAARGENAEPIGCSRCGTVASMTTKGPRNNIGIQIQVTHPILLLLIDSSHLAELPLAPYSIYKFLHPQQPWQLRNSKDGSGLTTPPQKATCNGANSSLRSGRKTTLTLRSLTAACVEAISTRSRLAGARL